MDLFNRVSLKEWYWRVFAFWTVIFVSVPAIVSIGFDANFFQIAWLLLTGWPENDFFAAIFRPLRLFMPIPLVLLPFAIRIRPAD